MGNRGILSSLGAGLSLVVAGVIVLAVVSGIVAFRGWPELREDTSVAQVPLAVGFGALVFVFGIRSFKDAIAQGRASRGAEARV